ncbi:MAG: HNH endonuclease, partial [Planctomycetes bacterium]|nr:HNH endonuclease [Planctomycetota bacterium]
MARKASADVAHLHDALVAVAKAEGALDLAFGEGLVLLLTGDRLVRAGYATERDYARERLGVPPKTVQNAVALARACMGRPLLRKAVVAGVVSPCKARVIARLVAENEPAWTALAMTSTVRELEKSVRAAGKEPPDEFEGESLSMRMTPAQQDVLDRALKLADEVEGGGTARWQCYEALAQEWLSEHGEWAPEEEAEGVRGPGGEG